MDKHSVVKLFMQFILLLALHVVVMPFNIEERIPFVKRGPTGSLFGLSVAEHHLVEKALSINDTVMLIGAPTSNRSSYHSADSVQPGALFSCQLNSKEDDCQSITIDTYINSVQSNNSNQWLGVSVKSQKPGGKVAVCAHRFTMAEATSSRGRIWEAEVGRCYLLDNDMSVFDTKTPCSGEIPSTQEQYGYCQAGTSVDFSDTSTEDLIIGTPGIFSWTGGIKLDELQAAGDISFFSSSIWRPNARNDKIFGEDGKNSYLGFSIATGVFLPDKTYIACGAPRANDTGVVVIFEKVTSDFSKELNVAEILHGERLASSFGYAVEIADINGDGRQDLIVGAPQYYDRDEQIGGAVYIYINKYLGQLGPDATYILYGDAESSFGSSITTLGDINMDGANDIAIGAPGADNGVGKVYIYHGNSNPDVGIDSDPAQILSGSSLFASKNIEAIGFGYSLSGGLDMDFNGYPDLVVGSLSDIAILYRTRPIVNVLASITASLGKVNIDPEKSSNVISLRDPTANLVNLVTFNITVCMNYTSTPTTFDELVDMNYTIMLDVDRLNKGFRPRATFIPFEFVSIKTGKLRLFPQSRRRDKCKKVPIYLDREMQDKLSPFIMSVSYDVWNKSVSVMPNRNELSSLNPVMNFEISNTTSTQVNISKDCGDDDICRSMLKMHAEYVVLNAQNTWQELQKGEDDLPLLFVGTEKAIGFRFNVDNMKPGEDAHQAKLKVELPGFLHYNRFTVTDAQAATLHCNNAPGNLSLIICDLGNPFLTDSQLSAIIELRNDKELYEVRQFTLYAELSTSSTQKTPGRVAYSVSVRVQAEITIVGYTSSDQVPFSGKPVGESSVRVPADAGTYIDHSYEVENTGTTDISNVFVSISWPQAIDNGKWLFYLLSATVVSPDASTKKSCDIPAGFNPLHLPYIKPPSHLTAESVVSRKVRDTETKTENNVPTALIQSESPSNVLSCTGTIQCLEFDCFLGTISDRQKSFIHLVAVAWNSTFLEEYKSVHEVRVFSKAEVKVNLTNVLYADTSHRKAEVSTSMLAANVVTTKEPVSYWIIIVAILAGVVLFVIIVLVLWKCGFFKRRRDFGDYHKARKHRQASKKADESQERMVY